MVARQKWHSRCRARPRRSRRERRHDEILTKDARTRRVIQEFQDSIGDCTSEEIGFVEHERPVIVVRYVSHLEDHGRSMCRYGVLEAAPTKREVAAHLTRNVSRVVFKSC